MWSAGVRAGVGGGKGNELELGQIVVEVLEQIRLLGYRRLVVAAQLVEIVVFESGGQLVEHIQELAGGLVGELGRVVEDQGCVAHEKTSIGG